MESALLDRPRQEAPDEGIPFWFSTAEAAREVGITYRQLDYWFRSGVLPDTAKGSGTRRRVSLDDVRKLRTLAGVARVRPDMVLLRQVADLLDWETSGWVVIGDDGPSVASSIDALGRMLREPDPVSVIPIAAY